MTTPIIDSHHHFWDPASGGDYGWLSGPNKGYGFGSSGPPHRSMKEHRESICAFLAMIDPNTAYIGDN